MVSVNIFKPDTIDYGDYGYKKPIRYSEDFLRKIADDTEAISLNEEHTDKIIGSLSDFVFKDGYLTCNVDDAIDVKGKGISPKFGFDLVEYEDYYLAVDGVLIDAGLTDSPRSHIVCNSIQNGDDMTEDLLKREMERNAELERQLAKKDSELNSVKERNEQLSALEETVAQLQKENDKYSSEYEALKVKATAYDEGIALKKAELIEKVAEGDEERQKQLQNISYNDLELMYDVWEKNKNPVGVGSGEEGNITPPENKPKDDSEDLEELFTSVFGKKPSKKYN